MKTVWVATMDTEHYEWVAVGATPKEAMTALKDRWDRHILSIPKRERGAGMTWRQFQKAEGQTPAEHYGAWCRKLVLGRGYLDDESEESYETSRAS